MKSTSCTKSPTTACKSNSSPQCSCEYSSYLPYHLKNSKPKGSVLCKGIFLCQVRQDFRFPFLQQKTKLPSRCIKKHSSLVQEKNKQKCAPLLNDPKLHDCWLHREVVQLPGPAVTEERQAPGMKDNQCK